MNYITFPNNFLELPEPLSNYEDSKIAMLPVPYEKTTTYLGGTKDGPEALINASQAIEFYDEEIDKEACTAGVCTLNNLEIEDNEEKMQESIYSSVKKIIEDKKFPIIIGGEHSITPACVRAFSETNKNLSVLQLDAHCDLREEWNGSKNNHACAIKRSLDYCKKVIPVGIRSVCKEEMDYIQENNIKIFWDRKIHANDDWMDETISLLSDEVYITIDLDGFDPAWMPAVGNPEPGGLQYYQTLRLLRKVFREKNVVGMDVVELSPRKDDVRSDFAAAKIIYKLIGYKFFDFK
ncbi:agmatinase [Candidatus Woesearchaeota archaeon]|nr:agmatinase [Candidatus Woesearchaeota archaeon]